MQCSSRLRLDVIENNMSHKDLEKQVKGNQNWRSHKIYWWATIYIVYWSVGPLKMYIIDYFANNVYPFDEEQSPNVSIITM